MYDAVLGTRRDTNVKASLYVVKASLYVKKAQNFVERLICKAKFSSSKYMIAFHT